MNTDMNQQVVPTKATVFFLLFASMLVLMGGAAVAPALHELSAEFSTYSDTIVRMIVTLPALAVACTGFFIGGITDRIGRKKTLCISLLLFVIAGVSGYFLPSLPMILVSRIILGFGIGGILTSTTALIAEYYPGSNRAKILGYQAAAFGIGGLILETSGGILTEIGGGRTPFLLYLIGIVILIGVIFTIREPVHEPYEHKTGGAGLNKPIVFLAFLLILLTEMIYFITPTYMASLAADFGLTASYAGFLIGLGGLVSAIPGLIYGRFIIRHLSRNATIFLAFLCMAVGMILLGTTPVFVLLLLGTALQGFGIGVMMPALPTWIASVTNPVSMGLAMGIYAIGMNLGQFLAPIAAVPLLALTGSYSGLFFLAGVISATIGVVYLAGSRLYFSRLQ